MQPIARGYSLIGLSRRSPLPVSEGYSLAQHDQELYVCQITTSALQEVSELVRWLHIWQIVDGIVHLIQSDKLDGGAQTSVDARVAHGNKRPPAARKA